MQSLWMVVAGFLFAGMGVCVKLSAKEGYSLAEIVFYRSVVMFFIMLVLVRWRNVRLATPHWLWHVKRGVTGFCSLSVYFCAISLLPLATAVTLNYTSPVFLVLMLMFFRGLRLNRGIMFALGMGFLGVVFLLQPTFEGQSLFGASVALASAVLTAMVYFDVSGLGRLGEPVSRTVFYFSLISTLLGLVWIVFSSLNPITFRGFLMLAGTGIFATLGQLTMTRAYSRGKVLLSASLTYTTVIFAMLSGVILWGEHLGWMEFLGVALVIVSGVSANYFLSRTK
ncbi:MAG: DMT family transporter [Azoarcus sp.]|jgi:S-adenosylmethionine uptake transporter|nr:DMT family transporter [Azoarcus sp.]